MTMNFDMSTSVRPPSPRLGRLEGEALAGKRVCSEDVAIEDKASSGPSVLTMVSVYTALCRLAVSAGSVSCSLWRSLTTTEVPMTV